MFGTLAFLLPFAFALVTIPTTLGIVWIFANFMELTTYVTNLVSLIGLGIAIDYSLLVVYRFREELRNGARHGTTRSSTTMDDRRPRGRLLAAPRSRSGSPCCSSCRCRSCAASGSAACSSRRLVIAALTLLPGRCSRSSARGSTACG